VRLEHLADRLHRPWHRVGEQAVKDESQAVDVGGGDDRAAGEPLRGQVGRGTPEDVGGLRVARDGGDAEVHDLRAGRGEHDVARLDVAVHHPAHVRRGQRGRDLRADQQRGRYRQRPGREPLRQRGAVDQLHDHVRQRLAGRVL
jgi:hypothetical protein